MGCDGGTIPTRDELVRTKKKPERKDKIAELAAKWKLCAITQEPLRQPVMACELGRLYNKESVLEFLIDRSKFECAPSFSHLKGFKDLKELKLTDNPAYEKPKNEKGDAYIDSYISAYICPVVGLEMNGVHKFCFIWTCGCVLSERAFKEVKGQSCHKCGKEFDKDDILVLNGSEEEVDNLYERMEARRLKAKLKKKAKKSQKHKLPEAAGSSSEETSSSSKNPRLQGTSSKDSLANGNPDVMSKRTNGKSDHRSKLPAANGKRDDKNAKTVSIQKNPHASSVYKSLFTTSEEAKSRPTAHWVTYNPCFN